MKNLLDFIQKWPDASVARIILAVPLSYSRFERVEAQISVEGWKRLIAIHQACDG